MTSKVKNDLKGQKGLENALRKYQMTSIFFKSPKTFLKVVQDLLGYPVGEPHHFVKEKVRRCLIEALIKTS